MQLKKHLSTLVSLALVFGLTACGNNKAKDKVMSGSTIVNNGGTDNTTGGGITSAETQANAQAATGARMAAAAAKATANGVGNFAAPGFMGAPIVMGVLPGGMTYDTATEYYTMSITGGSFKIRFECALGTSLRILENMANPADVRVIRIRISGTDPAGNSYTVSMDQTGLTGLTGVPTTMHLIGTVDVTARDGSTFAFTSDVVVDSTLQNTGAGKGAVKSGTETGTGTLADGATKVTVSLTFTNGVADGTATVTLLDGTKSVITIHLNADGTGTYTDSTGTHTIA